MLIERAELAADDICPAGWHPTGLTTEERHDALQTLPFQRRVVPLGPKQENNPVVINAI
jgi:hypothetical protein